MNEHYSALLLLLLATNGAFCIAALFQARARQSLRLRWVSVEHDDAQREGREPRRFEDVFGNPPQTHPLKTETHTRSAAGDQGVIHYADGTRGGFETRSISTLLEQYKKHNPARRGKNQ